MSVSGGAFRAGGSGTLQLTGTAGNPTTASNAVSIGGDVATAGGNIVITGTPVNVAAPALNLVGIVAPGNGGSVVVVADRVTIAAGGGINAPSHSVTFRPKTAGQAIELGGADSATALGLTDQELDFVVAAALNIGDANSGPITVANAITRPAATAIGLTSGGAISFVNGSLDPGGGNLKLAPGTGAATAAAGARATPTPPQQQTPPQPQSGSQFRSASFASPGSQAGIQ